MITSNQRTILDSVTQFCKNHFSGEASGHDWFHILRVVNLSNTIAIAEGANLFITELAALTHDLDDIKLSAQDSHLALDILTKSQVEQIDIDTILQIHNELSFKGAHVVTTMTTLEGKCVQDADRLDAIGAIGIARTFAYGGSRGRILHDPDYTPVLHKTANSYHTSTNPTIAHFYEKLLLLKDLMNTDTAKQLASLRHKYMEQFLQEFYAEWEGVQ
jgi:uncharacterized protein